MEKISYKNIFEKLRESEITESFFFGKCWEYYQLTAKNSEKQAEFSSNMYLYLIIVFSIFIFFGFAFLNLDFESFVWFFSLPLIMLFVQYYQAKFLAKQVAYRLIKINRIIHITELKELKSEVQKIMDFAGLNSYSLLLLYDPSDHNTPSILEYLNKRKKITIILTLPRNLIHKFYSDRDFFTGLVAHEIGHVLQKDTYLVWVNRKNLLLTYYFWFNILLRKVKRNTSETNCDFFSIIYNKNFKILEILAGSYFPSKTTTYHPSNDYRIQEAEKKLIDIFEMIKSNNYTKINVIKKIKKLEGNFSNFVKKALQPDQN